MPMPLFDDVEPPPACGCEGCARQRLADSLARDTRGPAGTGATRALVVAAVAGTALSGTAAAAVPRPAAVTGHTTGRGSLAAPAAPVPLRLTRAQILQRAKRWVTAGVPYSMTAHWKDGYRQDCSGFVSMAWGLGVNAWTGDLAHYAVRVTRDRLRPGDLLLFHNTADPQKGSHAVIFAGWANRSRTRYKAYEQAVPGARARTTPYAYWVDSAKYVPYRYRYLAGSPGPAATGYPGRAAFGTGRSGAAVARLGSLLIGRGAGAYYRVGPGRVWSAADRAATAAFQRAQGWTGAKADGMPGPTTWSYLVHHKGHDIAGGPRRTTAHKTTAPSHPGAGSLRPEGTTGHKSTAPPYPGAGSFRPGRGNDSVLALGHRLVAKGFGAGYRPSRHWREADRRKVEAFQRAQGWSGRSADGHPGPETWRRLFS
ncbi:peptidoglycan-binding protein [Actinacidiphila paucisporea]|uniref:NlpC/P60 family protein n=1 Tax=Actinacidiphila paucisporea TaxID=310782 RepID=A0A1M7LHP1_9ACTN|nr:peptidoglycan-binding protein [Actinacidiphila paucisporea]SHM77527.1 NlpC/P60 family protein [Actinacidiphila paucisporea]